jgi:hypothetical protein
MADVSVSPQEFTYVDYDAGRIAAVAGKLLDDIGLAGPLHLEVDESTPAGRITVESLAPLRLAVQGGAFEDTRIPRQLSERHCADSLGRVLMRVRDRLDPAFGEPPPDDELTLPESVAWDAYGLGRLRRLGYPVQRQRRLYQFRTRHGFSDEVDTVFERLWTADVLTWEDIRAACRETGASAEAVPS